MWTSKKRTPSKELLNSQAATWMDERSKSTLQEAKREVIPAEVMNMEADLEVDTIVVTEEIDMEVEDMSISMDITMIK